MRIREQITASFQIVATSWLGDADEVLTIMGLSPSSRVDMPLLSRDRIVGVVNSSGIYKPDWLIAEIVNQADGRPGLASLLSFLCVSRDPREVITGDGLLRHMRHYMSDLAGEDSTLLLAAFSLGGKRGVAIDVIEEFLGESRANITEKLVRLGTGGIEKNSL